MKDVHVVRNGTELVLEILDKLQTHPIRTAAVFRAAMTENTSIFAANPLLELANDNTNMALLREVMLAVQGVIMQGRMIDFGYVPNDVLKAESLRARTAFEAGEMTHPFDNGWVGTMAWEGGYNAYYVQGATDSDSDNAIFVFELYGVETTKGPAVMLYDAMRVHCNGPGDTRCVPAPLVRNAPTPDGKSREQFDVERAANALDPLVTMLRFLSDASIPVTPIPASEKLNKARAKRGKPQIPAHTRVETRDYVTMITRQRAANGHADRGGHQASPVAHFRRGHLRRIAADRVVQVRSSKVNWRSSEDLHRIFYQVKGAGHAPQK